MEPWDYTSAKVGTDTRKNTKLFPCPPNSPWLSRQREAALVHPLYCRVSHWPKPSPKQQQPQPNHQWFALKCQAEEFAPVMSLPVPKSNFSSCTVHTSQNLLLVHFWVGFLQLKDRPEILQEKKKKKKKAAILHTWTHFHFLWRRKKLSNLRRKTLDCEL